MNDANPYQTPAEIPQNKPDNQKIQSVASAQRLVLLALLTSFGVNIVSFVVSGQQLAIQVVFLFVALAVVCFMVFAMYNLAKQLNSQGLAVLYAVLMIVPCISLIMLLVVNQQATGFLTSHGIKVGLMGADMNQFR